MDTERPVVCWESLGLPDLDCDEKPGWISSSSLAGELIQPGPQEVWMQPTHKHALPAVRRVQRNQGRKTVVEISQRTSDGIVRDTACYGDKDTKLLMDWAGMSDVGEESDDKRLRKSKARWRETLREKGVLLKDRNYIPLEGRLSWKIKNSLDDLFIFCSSKILFHMNVSVLKKKSLSFILFMPFGWEILFIFCCFVPLCSTWVWRLAIVCVKFCNNIKRRYGRVNNNLFLMSFLPTFMCNARWMIAVVHFPILSPNP